MTGSEFAAAGRAIYGPRWKAAMARQLGCSRFSVHKMAKFAGDIPAWAANHVALLERHLAPQPALPRNPDPKRGFGSVGWVSGQTIWRVR